MAKGVMHYTRDGKAHKGATHKHPDGTVMTGSRMNKTSKELFHYGSLSKKAKAIARQGWGK